MDADSNVCAQLAHRLVVVLTLRALVLQVRQSPFKMLIALVSFTMMLDGFEQSREGNVASLRPDPLRT